MSSSYKQEMKRNKAKKKAALAAKAKASKKVTRYFFTAEDLYRNGCTEDLSTMDGWLKVFDQMGYVPA
jgi:hypothetical protein